MTSTANRDVAWYRERMDEIPRDVPVYLHCRSSQRSYYAICCLQGNGYDPRKLLAPGAEAIKATVREKIELFGSANKA